jgi:hypothetical protein
MPGEEAATENRTHTQQLFMAFGFREVGILFSLKKVHKY